LGDKYRRDRNNVSSNQQPTHAAHVVFLRSMLRLPVTVNVVPSSSILVTLMMEALLSSETSVLTIVTRRNIQQDGILGILVYLHSCFRYYTTECYFPTLRIGAKCPLSFPEVRGAISKKSNALD
jgi:hypothetical protein